MSSWLGFRLDTAEVVSSNLIRPTKAHIICTWIGFDTANVRNDDYRQHI